MEHFYQNIGEDWFDYQEIYSMMVDKFEDGSHFVEVGSWKGRSSVYMAVEMINSEKKIKFDCVDTWNGSEEHISEGSGCFVKEILIDRDWLFNQFINNIEPVKNIINPIRDTSESASKKYKDGSLDFIWIDAAHDYDNVFSDISNWIPKLKIDGYIGGHDYHKYCGVEDAVNDFFGVDNVNRINKSWLHKKTI
jgi:hypothetical protein